MPTIVRRHTAHRTDRTRKSRGQSLVELALILPILFVFLAAALDLGRVFYAHISLRNAAREGAMQAAKTPTSYLEDTVCDPATNLVVCRVILEAKGGSVTIQPTDIEMTCAITGCPRQSGSTVRVDVRGQFQLVTPLLAAVFGGQSLNFSSTAIAQIEYYPDPVVPTVPPAPVASFTVNPSPPDGDAPRTVQFTDTSTDASQWFWDFGDGATSNDQNPSHTYTAPGTFTVILTAINETSADVEQLTITISGTPAPSVSASASAATCTNPPNLIGLTALDALAALSTSPFQGEPHSDLTSGPKGKVQAQNPDHTQCLTNAWISSNKIVYHYRPA